MYVRTVLISASASLRKKHSTTASSEITVNTVQKADTKGNGTHIQILLLYHFICLIYFKNVDHILLLASRSASVVLLLPLLYFLQSFQKPISDTVHHIENIFMLAMDHYADLIAQS